MGTFEKVREIIIGHIGFYDEPITIETGLIQDIGLDSLDLIEIMIEIEERFNIVIPGGEESAFQNVGDIVDYVDKYRGE